MAKTREEKIKDFEQMLCKAPDFMFTQTLLKFSPFGRNKTYELINTKELKSTIKSIADKFEFTNNTVVFIKEELKKAKDDKVAADFLKQIKKGVELNGKDKSEVLKEMFLSKMKNSKSMQKAFNREFMNNAIKKIAGADKTGKMTNLMNGFKTAQALMVFALIYRFVSPVIATPIANYVSEKLETKKHQKALTQAA